MFRKVDWISTFCNNFSFVARITTGASTCLAKSLNFAANERKKDIADGEDELEAVEVDQKLSQSHKFASYKDLEGYRTLWDTSFVIRKKLFVPHDIPHFKFSN